jgi:hypothetical protein
VPPELVRVILRMLQLFFWLLFFFRADAGLRVACQQRQMPLIFFQSWTCSYACNWGVLTSTDDAVISLYVFLIMLLSTANVTGSIPGSDSSMGAGATPHVAPRRPARRTRSEGSLGDVGKRILHPGAKRCLLPSVIAVPTSSLLHCDLLAV